MSSGMMLWLRGSQELKAIAKVVEGAREVSEKTAEHRLKINDNIEDLALMVAAIRYDDQGGRFEKLRPQGLQEPYSESRERQGVILHAEGQ